MLRGGGTRAAQEWVSVWNEEVSHGLEQVVLGILTRSKKTARKPKNKDSQKKKGKKLQAARSNPEQPTSGNTGISEGNQESMSDFTCGAKNCLFCQCCSREKEEISLKGLQK